ncbi:TetR/AcrR family transcriptional regulator [Geodermatophilus sp. SYSU D00965]
MTEPGLRERKKVATRRALHRAALELVAERGLDAVSVDDIAARAEVSPRTFFNYFSTKDDAVIGTVPTARDDLVEVVLARPASESPVEVLRAIAGDDVAEILQDAELWPMRLRVVDAHPVLVARLMASFAEAERIVSAAVAARTGADVDGYPALLAAVHSAVMRTSLHRWLTSGFAAPLADLVDEAWDLVEAGLPAPPR